MFSLEPIGSTQRFCGQKTVETVSRGMESPLCTDAWRLVAPMTGLFRPAIPTRMSSALRRTAVARGSITLGELCAMGALPTGTVRTGSGLSHMRSGASSPVLLYQTGVTGSVWESPGRASL